MEKNLMWFNKSGCLEIKVDYSSFHVIIDKLHLILLALDVSINDCEEK